MKIILLKDDKKIGKKGQIIEASDGFARNYIIPQKIGIEATSKNLNDLKLQKANEAKIEKENLEEAQRFAAEIADKVVVCRIKTGEGGKTFGSVSSKEIVAAFKEQFGIEIDKKKIVLNDALKNLGTYEIGVKIHPQVTGKFNVRVDELK